MSTTGTWSGRPPRELNEETIGVVRARIGIPVRYSPRQHNEVSSTDSFRHFAVAYGDDNPLYTSPVHAEASSWGSSIAPPLYPFTAGRTRPVEWSDAEKAEMSGGDPLAGIGQYMCGERWMLLRPVRAGDVLWRTQSLYLRRAAAEQVRWWDRRTRVTSRELGRRERCTVRVSVPRLLARRSRAIS